MTDKDLGARVRKNVEPDWNELREQRVLARIQESKRARLAEKKTPRAFFVVAAAAVVIAGAFGLSRLRPQVSPSPAPIASVTPAKMSLTDGSEVALASDASVHIDEQGEEQVRLTQSAGEARYEVVPNPKRHFSVRAGDVTVRVLGTAFTVAMVKGKVRVVVHRGRVEVEGGGKTTVLALGETLEVPAVHVPEPAASPMPSSALDKKPSPPTIEALLQKADEARAANRYDDATTSLRAMIASYPGDPRVASAWFTLGRVERARGRQAAAADAFAHCHKFAPHGALAEDAMAEEAVSWKSAGDSAKARDAAKRYLKLHPGGAHAARMMPLSE